MSWVVYNFRRTARDSVDQTLQIVVRQLDGTLVPISDEVTATMHIKTNPVTIISSTNQGVDNGVRGFNGNQLAAINPGTYSHEIQIVIEGADWTVIKGQAQFLPEIA